MTLSRAMLVGCVGLAASCAVLGGCRGERTNKPPRQFFPDLDDQEKYKPQAESNIFADRRTMRDPPSNTVAFGKTALMAWGGTGDQRTESAAHIAVERADLLKEDDRLYTGKNADGTYVAHIPVPVTMALLKRGQERFNIYCTPCHGYKGDGLGMVGQQWSYALPTFHDPKYVKGNPDPDGRGFDGFVFWTIRNGVANAAGQMPPLKMPSYRNQVNEKDAWAIVAYFRALQRSQAYPAEKIPDGMRPELERTRGQQKPAAPTAAVPTTPEATR